MNKSLVRWLIFLFVGIPTQMIMLLLYPTFYLYWRIFVYEKVKSQVVPNHEAVGQFDIDRASKTTANGKLLNNKDDHGALSMYGFIGMDGLKNLTNVFNHHLVRRAASSTEGYDQSNVSGDVVISWAFATVFLDDQELDSAHIENVAKAYLKSLGSISYDKVNNGDVSNRCNNFGINYCPDSALLKLGQPMAGPQFYTNSALFALASKKSYFFKLVFWTHWLLFGGWYWAFAPVLYTEDNGLFYVRDMTMKALYVHKRVFGNKWWINKPMELIAYNTPARNDLFYAMLGFGPVKNLPKAMDAFFSQKADATSRKSEIMSAYIPDGIMEIYSDELERKNLK
jgi:hypothetical protein